MTGIIEADDLTKRYGEDILALDNVTFSVQKGEVFGLLGPNGAGKSTLISILTTYFQKYNGKVRIDGHDISEQPHAVRSIIGVAPQEMTLDYEMTGRENMQLQADLYGIPRSKSNAKISELLGVVDLEGAADRMVKTYSGGMRRRLELAEALIHDPRVLFLDEPTIGLDVQTRTAIWGYILRMKERGGLTVFLTTHYLEEADEHCDRVAIIDRGRILSIGTPAALKNSVGGDVVTLSINGNQDLARTISNVEGVIDVRNENGQYRIKVRTGEETIPRIFSAVSALGTIVSSISLTKPSLDEVFLEYTGRTLKDAEEANTLEKIATNLDVRGLE